MAISRNNISMKLKGRVGAFSYYTSTGGRQIARVAQNASNYGESASRTELQQNRRVRWANLVNFYKINKDLFQRAYETKKPNQSDYNKFMSVNIPIGTVALTKKQASMGMCVLEGFKISEGSLQSITYLENQNVMESTLELPGVTDVSELTIGDFSTKLIDANPFLREGDQISYVAYNQWGDAENDAYIDRILIEVTLYRDSVESMARVDPNDTLRISNGKLAGAMGGRIPTGCFILSRLNGSTLQVSTEGLQIPDNNFLPQFTSPEAVQRAIDSYGLSKTAFLTPGSAIEPKPAPVPQVATITLRAIPESKARFVMGEPGSAPIEKSSMTVQPNTDVYIGIYNPNDPDFVGWSNGITTDNQTITVTENMELIAFFSGQNVMG